MSLKSFAGAHTALVTPFLPDGGVDWAGFERNVAFQIDQGIAGLLPVGTTGESYDDYKLYLKLFREYAEEAGRMSQKNLS